jgi:hypothetical protein
MQRNILPLSRATVTVKLMNLPWLAGLIVYLEAQSDRRTECPQRVDCVEKGASRGRRETLMRGKQPKRRIDSGSTRSGF